MAYPHYDARGSGDFCSEMSKVNNQDMVVSFRVVCSFFLVGNLSFVAVTGFMRSE